MIIKLKLTLAALALLGFTARATEAVQNILPLNLGGFIFQETGYSFKPNTNCTVTSLGFRFDASTNSAAYVVRLLDAGSNQLATATLHAGPSAAVQLLYTNIAPVPLVAGATNFLVCYDAVYYASNTAKLWTGPVIDSRVPSTGSFGVAPEIQYLGACTNTALYGGTNAPFYLFTGPNLQFTTAPVVIQPSTLTLTLVNSNTVALSWPATDTLGQLQSAPALTAAMADVTNAPAVVGSNRVVQLPLVPPRAFFRLRY